MLQDLVHAARTLRRAPGFTLVAATTLALGVAATTGVFSVLDTVVLRPLPYPGSERMMLIGTQVRGQDMGSAPGPYSSADFLDLRNAPGPFEALVAQEGSRSVLTGLGDPARVIRSQVSEGYFEVFGARPSLGRLLAPSDDGERVVVLSHGFWQERFGGDPGVLGRVLTLDSIGYEVVGVLSENFLAPEALPAEGAVAWVPLGLSVGEPDRRSFGLGVVGRRRPQSTAQDGRAHVERLIEETYGREDGPNFIAGAMVVELKEATVGTMGGTLGLALASVAILLLIGCVNVAGLLLARGTERRSEMAIRSALGAGRRRIVGQLMAESLFTGLAGGGLGAALAYGAVEAFSRWTPGGIPRLGEVTVDLRVLGFTLAVSLGTALVFGLLPALKAAREAGGPIAGMGLRTTQGRRTGLMRSGLILVETTLAILLSVGSGLMVHELIRASTTDFGFRPEGLVGMTVDLPRSSPQEEWVPFYSDLLGRAQNLPGLRSVALTTELPFGPGALIQTMTPLDGFDVDEGTWVPTLAVSGDYFSTMGITLTGGRFFSTEDLRGETLTTIVNEAFVQRYWPGRDGVGMSVKSGAPDLEEDEGTFEVVGVVADVRTHPARAAPPQMFFPFRGQPWRGMMLVARAGGERVDDVAAGLRQVVREAAPGLPTQVTTVRSRFDESMARPRFYTILFASLGTLALILASVGIYGTTAYTARSRVKEIGIRMALGADRARVVRSMVERIGFPVVAGVGIGLLLSVGLSGFLSGFLFHVSARDPGTYTFIGLFVLGVGLSAALLPAARASSVDPSQTLREEG